MTNGFSGIVLAAGFRKGKGKMVKVKVKPERREADAG
jgi:hypothetical protein